MGKWWVPPTCLSWWCPPAVWWVQLAQPLSWKYPCMVHAWNWNLLSNYSVPSYYIPLRGSFCAPHTSLHTVTIQSVQFVELIWNQIQTDFEDEEENDMMMNDENLLQKQECGKCCQYLYSTYSTVGLECTGSWSSTTVHRQTAVGNLNGVVIGTYCIIVLYLKGYSWAHTVLSRINLSMSKLLMSTQLMSDH